jgi:hypothetical protein
VLTFGALAALISIMVTILIVSRDPGSSSSIKRPSNLDVNGLFSFEAAELASLSPDIPDQAARRNEIMRMGKSRLDGLRQPSTTSGILTPPPTDPCQDYPPPDRGIFPPQQEYPGVNVSPALSQAVFGYGNRAFALMAGSDPEDPSQGVIVISERSYACSDPFLSGPTSIRTPSKNGGVRLTERDGEFVDFITTDSTS